LRLFLLFLFTLNLTAQDEYSFRVAYGEASIDDLGDIIFFKSSTHPDDLTVYSLDGGYLLKEDMFEFPLNLYFKGGLSYFNEGSSPREEHIYEGTLYFKVYYKADFLENRVRFGLGEGISYTSGILWSEYKEAKNEGDNTSKFLNYMDLSIDFDLGKLVKYKPLEDTYIGWTLKHRSGVFGLYGGVYGGSNYNTISVEKIF